MALKFKLTKSAFEKLSDDMKKEYNEDDDGKSYTLDVTGLPVPDDNEALLRAKTREKERADNLQEELDGVTKELETVKKSQTSDEKDVARVQARWEKKLEAAKIESDALVSTLRGHISKTLIKAEASKLAGQLSTSPDLMQDHVEKRLTVEFDADNNPTLKVLKDDKPSDMTVDKLGEEFRADKKFAPILTGNKSKGGGADFGRQPPSPLGGSANSEKPLDLAKAPATDLLAHVQSVREAQSNQQQ